VVVDFCRGEGLDDLCVRFIINLPPEELESVERICFQVEEAQWFYEDFIRPLDPSLPSLTLRAFSLRIFQHCPLFSQWDVQHYTTAFAEFLAYKSRVPVRGAIMLNEAMDQVVLVKGWKKGANWSFPRGKINKDEDDLDCAVREVYEETGYDIKGAGLVKDDLEMKYIEVNMREQNMRLYVFRGVPMDTHFEPKTRKEISKIEWYKLTDLPTAKKSKHQEAVSESLQMNANKFYMVAPFLVPLKKWIGQQRKRDNRQSSHAHLAPPAIFEETVTEDEPDGNNDDDEPPPLQHVRSYGPSDLPEVSVTGSHHHDASAQLKQLLNVNDSLPRSQESNDQHPHLPRSDEPKASALLALLREGSTVSPGPVPRAPVDQRSFPPEVPHSLPHIHPPFSSVQSPPQFPLQPENTHPFQHQVQAVQPPYPLQGDQGFYRQTQTRGQPTNYGDDSTWQYQPQSSAPYRQTGDPQFARPPMGDQQASTVPPASALPKLTNHTRALLDVFKSGSGMPTPSKSLLSSPGDMPDTISRVAVQLRHQPSQTPSLEAVAPSPVTPPVRIVSDPHTSDERPHTTSPLRPKSEHHTSLLNLFRKPHEADAAAGIPETTLSVRPAPVELSAQRTPRLEEKAPPSRDLLKRVPQHHSGELPGPRDAKNGGRPSKHEGHTSATVSGPLNQPHFDIITPSPRKTTVPNEFTRSTKPTGRTLFDPNQPPAVKILARPEDAKRSSARSPRAPKSTPLSTAKPPTRSTEPNKSFQPQILRRPQTESVQDSLRLESYESPMKPPVQATQPPGPAPYSPLTNPQMTQKPHFPPSAYTIPPRSSMNEVQPQPLPPQAQSLEQLVPKPSVSSRPGVQDDTHRQNLLSLFTKPLMPSVTAPTFQEPSKTESASKIVSATNEKHANGVGTISTRSRLGSVASVSSGPSQAPPEKRQTAAGDRAFLLGYLGRIASQEG
jgi:mRNA-decapping enzyme subunit 2